jgi:ring-1,2-phenylacetyl-CoA epoxidase subunit PaaE
MDAPLRFHELRVASVDHLTEDAVGITLDVPPGLADSFTWTPGQHLTVRAVLDGEDVRRSYSICADAAGGDLRIGVKRIPGGAFSTYATTGLRVGDVLEVMPPVGEFTHDPSALGRFVAVAAGSGITPVLSMVATSLAASDDAEWTLLYGNRTSRSIMFLEELEALKDRFTSRFQMVHVLSREPHEVPLFEGRIDADKLASILGTLIDPASVDGWYLCGPLGMVEDASRVLADAGVPDDLVHAELFFDERIESIPTVAEDAEGLATVTITLDGRSSVVRVDPEGPSILDHARTVRAEVPFACKGGMCATCKAVVTDGEVRMDKNYALTSEERSAGYVLTCQAHPVTDEVALSYDTHGGIGR